MNNFYFLHIFNILLNNNHNSITTCKSNRYITYREMPFKVKNSGKDPKISK